MNPGRIAKDTVNATTVYTDLNDDLPGTAELIMLTDKKLQAVVDFYQLYPLGLFRKQSPDRLIEPFIIALWGALDLKVPEWCGLIKNIQYSGGLTY